MSLSQGVIIHFHPNQVGKQKSNTKVREVNLKFLESKESFSLSKNTSIELWLERLIFKHAAELSPTK